MVFNKENPHTLKPLYLFSGKFSFLFHTSGAASGPILQCETATTFSYLHDERDMLHRQSKPKLWLRFRRDNKESSVTSSLDAVNVKW